MKNKIFKVGFGYLIIAIMVIGISIILVNNVDNQLQETTNDTQEEIPLQNAVGENKVETKKVAKAKTTKKKVVKKKKSTKKTTKKVNAKKYVKSKVKTAKVSTNVYQNYAHDLVINKYGWSEYDFQCLVKLWNRESGWNPNAHNKSSGAHGIPQSLPASKMRSEGADYYTNGYTQIRWGLKYIKGRYGSPSKAWQHSQKKGWY